MFNRFGLNRHVTDADLAAVWTDTRLNESTQIAASAHLRDCAACRARLHSLSAWLDGLRTDARREANETFPRERLAAQQAQILRRLEGMERPGRVLAFPRFTRAISVPRVSRQRWIAAAAVAGLVVGIGLGQIVDFGRVVDLPGGYPVDGPPIARQSPPERMSVQPINATSDEVLLYDQEASLSAGRIPESLRSLHEITPSARDYDPR